MKIVGKMNSKAIKRSTFKNYITLLCLASSIFFFAACDPLEPATESLYKVHFNLNEVAGATPETQIIHEGEFAERPHVEVDDRANHGKFAAIEWYQNKDGSGPVFQFASTPITSSYWLYAKWTNDFQTVTFEPNYTGAKPFFRHVGTGKTVEQPVDPTRADPTRTDFIFGDWHRADGSLFDFTNTPISTDITLYAGWRSGYVFGFKGREYAAILDGDTFLINVGKTYTQINDQQLRLLKVPVGFTTKPTVGSEIQLSKSWGSFEANENGQRVDYKVKVFLEPSTKLELAAIGGNAIVTEGINVNLNFVETRQITDMAGIFAEYRTSEFHFNEHVSEHTSRSYFNGDISEWHTSNVVNMKGMFSRNEAFNGDISKWDTSKVTDMSWMFYGAKAFNGDISKWKTSNVTDMNRMFSNAEAFNGDISKWDTSKVTDMSWMFEDTVVFNGDISNWNTSNVRDMTGMFEDTDAFNGDISKWNTSNVRDMTRMFLDSRVFNRSISKWNTSNVRDMTKMFGGIVVITPFIGDISKWNVDNVGNWHEFFSETSEIRKYPNHIPPKFRTP